MENNIYDIVDVRNLSKEELITRYEWQINNLVNHDVIEFKTPTEIADAFGKHVVEWNRILRDIGVLIPITRVGKKGNRNIEHIGWKISSEHRKYLLANGLALEVKETRDAVYWNMNKITHISLFINRLLKKEFMPQLKLRK